MRFPRAARAAIFGLLALPLLLQPLGPSAASRGINDIDKEIRDVRNAVEDAGAAEAKALNAYADALSRLKVANTASAKAEADLSVAQTALDAATAEYNRLAAEYDGVVRRLEDNRRETSKRGDTFDSLVQSLYRRGSSPGDSGAAEMLGKTKNAVDAASATQYYQIVSAHEQGQIDQLTQLHDEQVSLRDQLKSQRIAAESARVDAETKRDAVAEVQVRVTTARDLVAAEESAKKTLLSSIEAKRASYESQLKSLEAESKKLKDELKKSMSTGPMKGNGRFKYPVNAPITSYFGPRVHPIYHSTRMHAGLDLGAGCGTPIRAAGPGTVIKAGPYGGYGNATVIDHGGGIATLYGHQSKILVSVGDEVAQGDTIGNVGSTGASTGCHLHFEVRVGGDPVNPLAYL